MAKKKPFIDRVLAVYIKAKGKPRSVSEVAKLLDVSPPAVYHPAFRLAERKLLMRVPHGKTLAYVATPLALGVKPETETVVQPETDTPEPRTGGVVTRPSLPTMTYDDFRLIAELLDVPEKTALYLATKALLREMQEAQ